MDAMDGKGDCDACTILSDLSITSEMDQTASITARTQDMSIEDEVYICWNKLQRIKGCRIGNGSNSVTK